MKAQRVHIVVESRNGGATTEYAAPDRARTVWRTGLGGDSESIVIGRTFWASMLVGPGAKAQQGYDRCRLDDQLEGARGIAFGNLASLRLAHDVSTAKVRGGTRFVLEISLEEPFTTINGYVDVRDGLVRVVRLTTGLREKGRERRGTTVEHYTYGHAVSIEPPPESEVVSRRDSCSDTVNVTVGPEFPPSVGPPLVQPSTRT